MPIHDWDLPRVLMAGRTMGLEDEDVLVAHRVAYSDHPQGMLTTRQTDHRVPSSFLYVLEWYGPQSFPESYLLGQRSSQLWVLR